MWLRSFSDEIVYFSSGTAEIAFKKESFPNGELLQPGIEMAEWIAHYKILGASLNCMHQRKKKYWEGYRRVLKKKGMWFLKWGRWGWEGGRLHIPDWGTQEGTVAEVNGKWCDETTFVNFDLVDLPRLLHIPSLWNWICTENFLWGLDGFHLYISQAPIRNTVAFTAKQDSKCSIFFWS